MCGWNVSLVLISMLIGFWVYVRSKIAKAKQKLTDEEIFVGFFHPYWYSLYFAFSTTLPFFLSFLLLLVPILLHLPSSNAGGGGERVLWQCIMALQMEK